MSDFCHIRHETWRFTSTYRILWGDSAITRTNTCGVSSCEQCDLKGICSDGCGPCTFVLHLRCFRTGEDGGLLQDHQDRRRVQRPNRLHVDRGFDIPRGPLQEGACSENARCKKVGFAVGDRHLADMDSHGRFRRVSTPEGGWPTVSMGAAPANRLSHRLRQPPSPCTRCGNICFTAYRNEEASKKVGPHL